MGAVPFDLCFDIACQEIAVFVDVGERGADVVFRGVCVFGNHGDERRERFRIFFFDDGFVISAAGFLIGGKETVGDVFSLLKFRRIENGGSLIRNDVADLGNQTAAAGFCTWVTFGSFKMHASI